MEKLDLIKHDGEFHPQFLFDARDGSYKFRLQCSYDTSQEYEEYQGFVRVFDLDDKINAEMAEKRINQDDVQSIFKTITDGYDTEWDGRRDLPDFSDEAKSAISKLSDILDGIETLEGDSAGVWDSGEWLEPLGLVNEYGLSAGTTDGQLSEIKLKIEKVAEEENVYLHDLTEYLAEERERLMEDKIKKPGHHAPVKRN